MFTILKTRSSGKRKWEYINNLFFSTELRVKNLFRYYRAVISEASESGKFSLLRIHYPFINSFVIFCFATDPGPESRSYISSQFDVSVCIPHTDRLHDLSNNCRSLSFPFSSSLYLSYTFSIKQFRLNMSQLVGFSFFSAGIIIFILPSSFPSTTL